MDPFHILLVKETKETFMQNMKLVSVVTTCLTALGGIAYTNTGWTRSVESRVKEWSDEAVEALKKAVDKLGDDCQAIQEHLNNYSWKGIIEDKAISGPVTLKHLELNDYSRAIVVKPGEKIEAEVKCNIDSEQCSLWGLYRIVIGIKGEGPQTTIGNELGVIAGKSREKFTLIAPDKAGIYQVRFRPINACFKSKAFEGWKDDEGNEPDAKTTIGIIIVKS